MKIQVFSDLHLEWLNMAQIWEEKYDIDCDVLCLVGDIGNPKSDVYWSFIHYASRKAKYVLIVSGNHECWGMSQAETDHILSTKSKEFGNVEYLQKNVFFYGGYVFLGCTLWSHIPQQYHTEFQNLFPDFKNIQHCSPTTWNMVHEDHRNWLISALNEAEKRELKTVVLTHYTPLHNLSHFQKFKNGATQHMFSTDMRYLFNKVDAWCYGHTHSDKTSHVYKVGPYKTLFLSNQQGYPGHERHHFDKSFNISFPLAENKEYTTFDESEINFRVS